MSDRILLLGILQIAGIPLVKIETTYCGPNCGPIDHECRGHMHVRVLPNDMETATSAIHMLRDIKGIDAEVTPII